jgi:hypothetical protein
VNGEEKEIRLTDPNSKDLTDGEKMDLVVFSSTPTSKTVYKLMDLEVAQARDDAMECDPADEAKQRALMTVAHAMHKFAKGLKSRIEFAMSEHVADVRKKAIELELQDQEKVNAIIEANFQR